MSAPRTMTPLRRRGAIPGMTPPAPAEREEPVERPEPVSPVLRAAPASAPVIVVDESRGARLDARAVAPARRPSADYGATRLVNFRLPVDLHDRYRRLVADVERAHPRLRRPSLTEVLIGLLEEGPETVEEVADVIRRKRSGELGEEASR
jgi:hypothetical protein